MLYSLLTLWLILLECVYTCTCLWLDWWFLSLWEYLLFIWHLVTILVLMIKLVIKYWLEVLVFLFFHIQFIILVIDYILWHELRLLLLIWTHVIWKLVIEFINHFIIFLWSDLTTDIWVSVSWIQFRLIHIAHFAIRSLYIRHSLVDNWLFLNRLSYLLLCK
jgi:hypothetical protein